MGQDTHGTYGSDHPSKFRLLTQHNQEKSPDTFPCEKEGAGHKTTGLGPVRLG